MQNNTSETTISSNQMIFIILGVWLVIGICSLALSRLSTSKASQQKKIISNTSQDAQTLLKAVNILYELPKGETPTIATVSDKTKLQKQSFFDKAENGDKVLIYSIAKKAILYRPSTNKLIEVAPLALNGKTSPSVTPRIEQVVTVSIYNGSKIAGLAASTESKIGAQLPQLKVVEKNDAIGDYTKTTVVDTSGSKKDLAEKIATLLGGSIGEVPSREKSPKGEILIILGE
jgi:hypothetical protein